jgi:hypothetical protein
VNPLDDGIDDTLVLTIDGAREVSVTAGAGRVRTDGRTETDTKVQWWFRAGERILML